ncbi:MAG: hypothetical protein JWL71_2704 [Acidobacteria bacterium]|nr:hypothetical protein [Acidobacteriota bacterium]
MQKTSRKLLRSLVMTAGMAVVALTPRAASADFLDFTVSEGSVPGTTGGNITVDKLNGGYAEQLLLTSATTFSSAAYGNIGNFFFNEGHTAVIGSKLNNGEPNGYSLYALFSAQGTTDGNNFDATTAQAALWIDPNENDVFSFDPITHAVVITGNSDDYAVLTTNTIVTAHGSISSREFDFIFSDPTRTVVGPCATCNGISYLPDLTLLTLRSEINGDIDALAPGNPVNITGDFSDVFSDASVPEPATLGMLGFGLIAVARYRRKTV